MFLTPCKKQTYSKLLQSGEKSFIFANRKQVVIIGRNWSRPFTGNQFYNAKSCFLTSSELYWGLESNSFNLPL